MPFFVQMLSVSNTWQGIICGIQESSMILECNLAVFSGKISGNNLRIFVKFRIEVGFADTMSEMDREITSRSKCCEAFRRALRIT